MKGIFLALVCAFALTSATDESDVSLNHLGCPIDITITWLLPHERFCDRYYSCVVGTPVPMDCPALTAFDTEQKICNHISAVDCGDRTWPGEEDKSQSKESSEESSEEVTQRPLFGYDDPSKAQEICAEKGSENILISHEDCSKYYQCSWGRPIVLNCPSNLYYNPKNGQCDWQHNVDCKNVGVDNPNWSEAERECNKGHSLVPHKYCNYFYQCGPQGPIAIRCFDGTVFDYKLQTCNWPIFVDCGDKKIKPEEKEEEVTKPEVTDPEASESEENNPEASESEETNPEASESEETKPEVTEPEVSEPEIPEPEATEPEVSGPEVTDTEEEKEDEEVDDVIIGLPEVEN